MPKRIQDIIPNNKRTIRDIPTQEKTRAHTEKVHEKEFTIKLHKPAKDKVVGSLISYDAPSRSAKKKSSSNFGSKIVLIFIGSIVAVAIIGYFASSFYAVAKFDIVPISYPVEINKTVISQSSGTVDTATYSIANFSDSYSVVVPSVDGPYQESKSSGKITIYNKYSKSTQRLIAGTRVSSPSGLIYKLSTTVTVPGMTSTAPGQISVSVIAEKAGQEYNISKSKDETLSIVGFKGTPKYDTFYAKLYTDISGGFAGKKKDISKVNMASSTKYLEQKLFANLSQKAYGAVTDDKVLFDSGILFSTSTLVVTDNGSSTSLVTLNGTVSSINFDKKSLFRKLVGANITDRFEQYSFDIVGIDNLHVTMTNLKDFSVVKKNALVSNFEGSVTIVARIPADEIRSKLIGLPLSETTKIIRSYSSIIDTTSSGQVMPPWSKVPTRIDNIEINVKKVD